MATSSSTFSSSSSTAAFAEPLPLIVTDGEGRFVLVPETAAALSRVVTGPVVVVAVVGRYRTGKSFLMNRLAGSNSGFSLGCTVQSHTKGIWVWPRPHPLDQNKWLLLLDTEGLGDVESAGSTHDTWLFVMAVLLSTTLVYNVVGTLDKEGLEQLHFVLNMTDHVRTRVNQDEDELGSDFERYFPPLVICVRDFTLKLLVDGEPCSADEYMEHCLQMRMAGKTPDCRRFNEQRQLLCGYFKDRKCFVFPMPTRREDLESIESLPDGSLDPEFLATAEKFTSHVLGRAASKHIDGAILTGQSFVQLAGQYVTAQRDGAVPCIESALERVTTLTNLQAKEEALALYRERTAVAVTGDERTPLPTSEELGRLHQRGARDAVDLFHERSLLDREHRHEQELMVCLAEEYSKLAQRNAEASALRCERRLEELYGPIRAMLHEDEAFVREGAFREYERLMELLQAAYRDTQGLGDEKDSILVAFMKSKEEGRCHLLLLDNTISQAERERLERESLEKQLEIEKRALEQKNAQQQAQMQALREQMEENNRAFEEKIKSIQEQVPVQSDVTENHHTQLQDVLQAVIPIVMQIAGFFLKGGFMRMV
uniref:Guanylate-binding protein 1-like n=1 Tax=Petromyzon marinus TaxID=7757 RepID=A0AAJ7U4S8_PETMA|nr:guanylate-binding protein 1-like [Petromyzon marinus]